MSEARPPRVRVTGPPRRRTTGGAERARRDPGPDERLAGLYLRSLLREQLWLAARTLLVLVGVLGSLPLLFHLAPSLGHRSWLGVPLPWLLLGVAAYPFLVGLAWLYVRRAERNEVAYGDLVRGTAPPDPARDGPEGGPR
ncbi:DUF485 domain-containing protein [Nocardioides sp. Leaf374]|uniref:DUF485 domain-containing protein n=1 Tax=Nocardioides sp. Leaf374 TaxID=2876560 RepID=UPI001E62D51C|nr:DUF485 domain-containing protein [Nocardioides sp. Leaf374]